MKSFVCVLLVLGLVSCKSGGALEPSSDLWSGGETRKGTPLVMIANVENAFDGIDQGTEYPEFKSTTSNWNQARAESKARRVAEVFTAAGCPKIVISPEVENQNAAELIVEAAKECDYRGISANKDQKFPIGVAIFTTLDVTKVRLVETGYRPHLRVDFADGLSVIGVHFKSQRGGGDDLRAAAAEAIKAELANFSGRRLIVGGDFNTEEDLLAGTKLENCTARAHPTHVYQGEWHRLDKIYSTDCGEAERLGASFLMRNGKPYRSVLSQEGNRTVHRDEGYSDHIPLLMIN